jgi:hypothetical protein
VGDPEHRGTMSVRFYEIKVTSVNAQIVSQNVSGFPTILDEIAVTSGIISNVVINAQIAGAMDGKASLQNKID